MEPVYLGIDVGKTNMRIAVFTQDLDELARRSFIAANVPDALRKLRSHLCALCREHTVLSAGLSIFGPLDADMDSATYGAITISSEPAWSGVNLPRLLADAIHAPVRFDYDVNAGALAEHALGAAVELKRFVYLSLGTGIGAACYNDGIAPGFSPQFGHIFIPRELDDPASAFPGSCRLHRDCLQGLASGKALAERWKCPAEKLAPEHPAWDLQARYIARACANLVYTMLPERILLASSVALVPGLVDAVNRHLSLQLNGFLDATTAARYAMRAPVTRAGLAPDSSLFGAAILARDKTGLLYRNSVLDGGTG